MPINVTHMAIWKVIKIEETQNTDVVKNDLFYLYFICTNILSVSSLLNETTSNAVYNFA